MSQKRSLQKFRVDYSKKYPGIVASKLRVHHAFCAVCRADLSIVHGGIYDVKKHVDSKKHTFHRDEILSLFGGIPTFRI